MVNTVLMDNRAGRSLIMVDSVVYLLHAEVGAAEQSIIEEVSQQQH